MSSISTSRSHVWPLMVLMTLLTAVVAVVFHWRAPQAMSPHIMDMSQVARNLSEGHGFSTDFIRPFSLNRVSGDSYQPDLLHAPLYPFILSWAITFLGARDGVVSAVSLFFYILCSALLFQLVWRLCSNRVVACGTVAVFALSPTILSAADSGNSLLLSAFLLLAMLLVLIPKTNHKSDVVSDSSTTADQVKANRNVQDTKTEFANASPAEEIETVLPDSSLSPEVLTKQQHRQFLMAGALAALCYLTDYLSLLYVLPLAIICGQDQQRWNRATTFKFVLGFVLLSLPWWVRNLRLTGNPFYTLQWVDLITNSQAYPGASLFRDLEAGTKGVAWFDVDSLPRKIWVSLTTYFFEAPKVPHLYLMPFVVAAYWMPHRLPQRAHLTQGLKTGLLIAGLLYIFALSALGRANASYLIPLASLVAYLGVVSFQQIINQWETAHALRLSGGEPRSLLWQRMGLWGVALVFLIWPLTLSIQGRANQAGRYDKNALSELAKVLPQKRAVVTDVPWAVAWYADRPAIWIPHNRAQLTQVESKLPVSGLYLSPTLISTPDIENEWKQIYQQAGDLSGYEKLSRPQSRDILYVKQPNLVEAQALVKAKPKDAAAYFQLGRAQIAAKNYQAALTSFQNAQRLRPQWFEPYHGAASAYIRLRNKEGTLRSLQQAQKLAPRAQKVLLDFAEYYLASGQVAKAIQTYERVLADSPNHAVAVNNLAFIYAERNEDIYRALELSKRAVMADGNNGQNWDTLGWVSYRAGRTKEAVAYLQQAAKLLPQNGLIQFHLAQALLTAGQRDQAFTAFRTALQLGLPPAEKRAAQSAIAKSS